MNAAAAATIPPTKSDEITKQLKKQQQVDTLVGKMKTLVTTLQTAQASTSFRQGNPSFGMKGRGRNPYTDRRGDPGGRDLPPHFRLWGWHLPQNSPSQPRLQHPQLEQGTVKTYSDNLLAVWGCGTPAKELSHAKRQGLFQGGVHEQPH